MERGEWRKVKLEGLSGRGEGRGLRVFNTKRNRNISNECENTEHED